MTLCILVVRYQSFGGPYCLCTQRGLLKRWYPIATLHGVTTQRTKDGGRMDLWNVGILPQHYWRHNPQDRRWRQRGPLKRQYPTTTLRSVTSQKSSTWTFPVVETSNCVTVVISRQNSANTISGSTDTWQESHEISFFCRTTTSSSLFTRVPLKEAALESLGRQFDNNITDLFNYFPTSSLFLRQQAGAWTNWWCEELPSFTSDGQLPYETPSKSALDKAL